MTVYDTSSQSSTRRPGRGCGCLLMVLAIPLLYYGLYFVLRGPLPAQPQFIAHRGGLVEHPENSLAAFRHAAELGADWLELDVQRSSDGELVVFHDLTVDRITDGSGPVADFTLDELRAFDLGNGERVPTFAEVIELAREEKVGLLPEIKAPDLYPSLESEMVDALREGGYLERSVIQSFEHSALATLVANAPDVEVCPLYGLWQFDLSNPEPEQARTLCAMAEMAVLYPWMIRQAQSDGRAVYIWFGAIEHPLTLRLLRAMGADGLMVDDPAALANILGR